MFNLVNGDIQHSNLFLHMPVFDEIHYEGYLGGKVRKYRAVREDVACRMLALTVIRKEEDIIWDAVEDLLKRSVADAAVGGVHGVYVFDLLTMDVHKEVKTYKPDELKTMLVNHARKLTPGQKCLLKYSSVYGILQKLIHEDWGKMTLKTSVEVFRDKPEYLDLLVKQLVRNFEFSNDPGILLLNDLSQEPLFDPQNTLQRERLKALMKKLIPESIEFPSEVYIQDKNGVRELLSGTTI